MEMLSKKDENELLAALQLGDVKAFDRIYGIYGKLIARKLHHLVRIPEQVEEIHQDVFTALWVQRHTLVGLQSLKAYLYRIVQYKVIDFYRKAARDKALQEELLHHVSLSYEHIEALLTEKENQLLFEDLLAQLPPQRQKVFRMVKVDGKSYAETAAYFEVSLSTVKDHMARSAEFFKQQLRQKYSHLLCIVLINLFLK